MRKTIWMLSFILGWALIAFVSEAQANNVKPRISSIEPKAITRGEKITITWNFGKSVVPTKVNIDDQAVPFVVDESGKKITVVVDSNPELKNKKGAGEYERSVDVFVGDEIKVKSKFRQLTWGVVGKARVFMALAAYGILVVAIGLRGKGAVFKSKTDELSLSKIQMAIWTVTFGLAYILLAAIWKDFLDITDGMFLLMGISSATAVGAKAIVIRNKIDPKAPNPSRLLSDYDEQAQEYRLSLHRCQIAIWTLIVLVIFVIDLISTMRLPEIPNKLMVLMGISGGTYLGFNLPAKK